MVISVLVAFSMGTKFSGSFSIPGTEPEKDADVLEKSIFKIIINLNIRYIPKCNTNTINSAMDVIIFFYLLLETNRP